MRIALVLAPVLFLAAARSGTQDPRPAPEQVAPAPEQVARGQQVFELVCSGCHTVDPPPDSAPPMRHVARHLRGDLSTFQEFAEHVRTYVPEPSPESSRLPPMAIERFGLMAALPLGDEVLTAAAAYIWTLADTDGPMGEGTGMGMGGGMGSGQGMRHRHGPPRDTTLGMQHRHRTPPDSTTGR